MKAISSIREGLGRVPVALNGPGYEGHEEAVRSFHTRVIWQGEDADKLSGTQLDYQAGYEDDPEDDVLGGDVDQSAFDPVFEIGSEIDDRFPGLGGIEGEKIQQSVLLHGMDALAWYVSFHYPGVQWGVYVPISGIAYLMKHAFSDLSAPLATKAHLAFHSALNHELFHFATDYTVAQAELDHQEPWFVPAKAGFLSGNPNYCIEEEQLANAYMLAAFRSMKPALRVRGKQAALRAFVAKQPKGYRDALEVRSRNWNRLLENLAERYGSHALKSAGHPALWSPPLGYDWSGRFPIRPRIDWRYCPIHLVDDSARLGLPPGWLGFFSRLSAIQETDGFLKKLEKLSPPIQRAWQRTKQKLGNAITGGADFKKWEKGGDDLFSVRVSDNFRAHLQRRKESDDWLAVTIGNHKEMGHG